MGRREMWATRMGDSNKKTGARYNNIALGLEHEVVKASGRRENKTE